MKWRFWRVVVRYGHVGKRKEVSVARYIRAEPNYSILDVMSLVNEMPGVKSNCIFNIEEINELAFERGQETEKDNFYLIKLMTFNPRSVKKESIGE